MVFFCQLVPLFESSTESLFRVIQVKTYSTSLKWMMMKMKICKPLRNLFSLIHLAGILKSVYFAEFTPNQ